MVQPPWPSCSWNESHFSVLVSPAYLKVVCGFVLTKLPNHKDIFFWLKASLEVYYLTKKIIQILAASRKLFRI